MRAHAVTSMTRPRRYAWRRTPLLIILGVCAFAISATASAARASASADTVRDWNRYAMAALANPPTAPVMPGVGQPAHLIQLHLAMVQGAVYDAVNAIDGGYQPVPGRAAADSVRLEGRGRGHRRASTSYRTRGPATLPTLPQAVRAWLDPPDTRRSRRSPTGRPSPAGSRIGEDGRAAMLTEPGRTTAASTRSTFVSGIDPGDWRLGPPQAHGARRQGPGRLVRQRKPFLVPNAEMLRMDGPEPGSPARAYAEDFNEVKALGSLDEHDRTADQTAAPIFWQDNRAIWNRCHALARG